MTAAGKDRNIKRPGELANVVKGEIEDAGHRTWRWARRQRGSGGGGSARGHPPDAPHFHMHVVPRRRVGSDWGKGPPHIAVIEGKTPTRPRRDVKVSLEREHEIAGHIKGFLR